MTKKKFTLIVVLALAFGVLGCHNKVPPEALKLSEQSLKFRQLQTRHFDACEQTVLSASAAVLQDLGYNIDEAATDLGVIVSSKKRDATHGGQVVGAILVALFTGSVTPVDDTQLIRASLVTNPLKVDENVEELQFRTAVRVTFQRIVTNTQGQISRREGIVVEEIYQEFFDKLSQSLFLEAHEI